MTGTDKSLFCFGYGYSCDYLGQALQAEGWRVAGTTRDAEKLDLMRGNGIDSYLFDYDAPLDDMHHVFRDVTHLLISTPPDDRGDPTFIMHGEDVREFSNLQWIGYLSTTGVYGDRTGGWVDETSELRPNTKRGSRRLLSERQWLSLYEESGLPVHVFRLAGIYGPGRSALDSVRAGIARRIDKPGHAFSRIHVEDIVQVLMASMAQPHPGAAYNLADDRAAPSHEVIEYACHLLGITPPPLLPYDEADMAPIARSFYADNKRVSNEKIKRELGVRLKFPDFKAGLRECLAMERAGRRSIFADFNGVGRAE